MSVAVALAIAPRTDAVALDGSPQHILRVGKVYDPDTGDVVIDVTDDLCAEVVKAAEALDGSWSIPVDYCHGLQRGKTPEERRTYGVMTALRHEPGVGVFADLQAGPLGRKMVEDAGGSLYYSPVVKPRPLHHPQTGEQVAGAWIESVSFTPVPRQGGLAPAALSRPTALEGMSQAEWAEQMVCLARYEGAEGSANEHRRMLEGAALKHLGALGIRGEWSYLVDWSDVAAVLAISGDDPGEGAHYRLPYQHSDEDGFSFGEPERVERVERFIPAQQLSRAPSTGEEDDVATKPQDKKQGGQSADEVVKLSRDDHQALLDRAEAAEQKAADVQAELDRIKAAAEQAEAEVKVKEKAHDAVLDRLEKVEAELKQRREADAEREAQAQRAKAEAFVDAQLSRGAIVADDRNAWIEDFTKSPALVEKLLSKIPDGQVGPVGQPPAGTSRPGAPLTGDEAKTAAGAELDKAVREAAATDGCSYSVALDRFAKSDHPQHTLYASAYGKEAR